MIKYKQICFYNMKNENNMTNNTPDQQKNEIVVYQPDDALRLEVRLQENTVWLTQKQMAQLFGCSSDNIGLHLKNIYVDNELDETATAEDFSVVQQEGTRTVTRHVRMYNLEAIISVGFRVNSKLGIQFRRWANKIVQDHLLRGYSVNARLSELEDKVERNMAKTELEVRKLAKKVDYIIQSAIPAPEQVFVNGQFLDAHAELLKIVRTAKKRIVLVDNFIDERVFTLLAECKDKVKCTIYSRGANKQDVQLAASRYAQQYPNKPITLIHSGKSHDRFLIIDNVTWHIGASPKDAGARIFALMKMELAPAVILALLP